MSDVLARIDGLLKQKKKSRNWLANRIGKGSSTVANWWHRNLYPKAQDLADIASALDTSLDYLITGESQDWFVVDDVLVSIMELLRPLSRDERVEVRAVIKSFLQAEGKIGESGKAERAG